MPLGNAIKYTEKGSVDVKSEYGKGSTFTLHVPVELEGSRKEKYSRHGFH